MRTLRYISWLLIVAIVVTTFTGCGWRLRGSQTMDVTLPPTYLEFHGAGAELRRELIQTLESANITLVNQAAEAGLLLTIHNENRGRRVLAVDTSGRVNEYELQYQLSFSVRDNAGATLIPQDTIVQQRDYSFDETQVLAKGEEEKRLFDFMRRMSIQALMRRLHSLNNNATSEPDTSDAN